MKTKSMKVNEKQTGIRKKNKADTSRIKGSSQRARRTDFDQDCSTKMSRMRLWIDKGCQALHL